MGDCIIDTITIRDATSTSQRIIEAIATAEGVDPVDLDPLYPTIDPDTLNSLVERHQRSTEASDSSVEVRFEYHGYEVRVSTAGRVEIAESDTDY